MDKKPLMNQDCSKLSAPSVGLLQTEHPLAKGLGTVEQLTTPDAKQASNHLDRSDCCVGSSIPVVTTWKQQQWRAAVCTALLWTRCVNTQACLSYFEGAQCLAGTNRPAPMHSIFSYWDVQGMPPCTMLNVLPMANCTYTYRLPCRV